MLYPVLTYSRNLGDFPYELKDLDSCGLKAIRLIYKGKSETDFNLRIEEIQQHLKINSLDMDILIDLPGSKPVVGDLTNGLSIASGLTYHLTNRPVQSSVSEIPTAGFFGHKSFAALSAGDVISIADDELNMVIKSVSDDVVVCEALNSFRLSSNRSMSVKNKPFRFEANSERDILFVKNLKSPCANISLLVSFTETAEDLLKLKSLQPEINIIPKIETIVDEVKLLDILDCCESVLLGRGDLSIAAQANEIFLFQKKLIELCRSNHKKLIVGTGLLAGIGDQKSPSIAEIMDYGYLRNEAVDAFLIAGSNAHNAPFETLKFMNEFCRQNSV